MRTAKSARTFAVLGASLAAMIVPGFAMGGIDSSSAQGIDSSSTAGIDSSSTYGIDSSSTAGIDSSSALGIDSSSTAGIDSSSALGIDSSSTAGIDSSSTALLLGGPVASIDQNSGTFVALGQTVDFSAVAMDALRVGDFVLVAGSITGAGLITADFVAITGYQYVPGATEVFVTGIPSSVDFSLGTAQIGELTVDYTLSLGGSGFEGIGAAITVIGTQPAFGGKMLSDQVVDMTKLFLRR
ncbi:MAG: hypothetical protein GWN47_06695 [Woeseiaceae bacterium]|nr:hypothetical protein [Woeseiaceae bacterium]